MELPPLLSLVRHPVRWFNLHAAGEILAYALPHLERNIHPVVIIRAYKQALADALEIAEEISQPVNIDSDKEMIKIISVVWPWTQSESSPPTQAENEKSISKDMQGSKKYPVDLWRIVACSMALC